MAEEGASKKPEGEAQENEDFTINEDDVLDVGEDNFLSSESELSGSEEELELQRPKKKMNRVTWTDTELSEIREYFANFLDTGTCPGKKDVQKVLIKSKDRKGELHRRHWHTIIKKISYINHKSGQASKSEGTKRRKGKTSSSATKFD